ncbi:unnamed protein product [Camellia sinensis]
MSDRCSRQFMGSCRTVVADTVWSCQTDVEDSLRGHVGPLKQTLCGRVRCRRQFTGSCRTVVAGQFTGSCRTVVEDSLRGHVGPM